MTYLNHYYFAQAVIDKFAMYAGRRFDVEIENFDEFTVRANRDEGFLHFSAHVGNYEIAGYTLVSEKKRIHAVVFGFEKASVVQNRTSMFDKTNISMISIKEDMSHLFEIDNALCNGDIVSFPTDRSAGATKSIEVMFLGHKTTFPVGPFSVATMRGLDVLAVNVMKVGSKKYKIHIAPLYYDKQASRREQMRQLAQAYAAELEKRLKEHPAQWFNFYDFWSLQE
jgi:predicted LPLAT superfamily acyltransferase